MRRVFLLSALALGLLLLGLASLDGRVLALALPLVVFLGMALLNGSGQPRFSVKRVVSADRVYQGTPITVQISVTNEGADMEEVVIKDNVAHPLKVIDGQTSIFTSLAGGETVTFEYTVEGTRGSYVFPDVKVTAGEHLGLFQHRIALPAAEEILILPAVLKLRRVTIRPLRTRAYAGPIPARQGGSGVEFFGVREYQPGDAMRWINWKVSARYQQGIFTNEFEQERIADVGLILDARQHNDVRAGGDSLFEYAVRATASLAEAFLNDGNRVGLLVYGGFLDWTFPGYGRVQRERILRALARAETGESLVFTSLDYIPTRFFPARSQIVLVSPLSEGDLSTLIRLRANGYQVLIISPDPVDFEVKAIDPAPGIELATRIANVERTLLIRRIQQAGIQVINWEVEKPFDQTVHSSLGRLPQWFRGVGVDLL